MLVAKRLNEERGSGLGSGLAVSTSNLPEGWRFERWSAKYCLWFDEKGNRYKSSKEVQKAILGKRVRLETDNPSETETETEAETASEYECTPVKEPRMASHPR